MKKVREMFPEPEEKKAEATETKAAAEEKKEPAEEKKEEAAPAHKDEISYDDFAKMEFRIGEIAA